MDETRVLEGIDFFDFLYELWRAKWLFAGIVVACIVLAGLTSVAMKGSSESAQGTSPTVRYHAAIPIVADPVFDPYSRSIEELWANLKSHLGEIDGRPFIDDNEVMENTPRPDYIYVPRMNTFTGVVRLDIKDGSLELAERFRASLAAAAEGQFQQTVSQVRTEIGLLNDIIQKPNMKDSDTLAKAYYLNYRFLSFPDVKDGTHRFFSFGPVMESKTVVQRGVSLSSPLKLLVLGAIVGVILACVAVMFRIAIERKMVRTRKA